MKQSFLLGLIASISVYSLAFAGQPIVSGGPSSAIIANFPATQPPLTPYASTQVGVTLGSIGTFSSVLAFSSTRHGGLIENTSTDVEYVYFGTTGNATTTNAFQLAAGSFVQCTSVGGLASDNVAMAGKAAASDTVVVQSN